MRKRCAVLVLALLVVGGLPATAKRGPEIVEQEEDRYLHLAFAENPAAQGWLFRPEVEGKADLIVALHGAGGNPKNFVMERLMARRGAFCLVVAGRHAVTHERGQGFQWEGGDVETVVALTRHVVESHPVDPDRVLVWGHSAGGSMTLATLAEAPELFAGGLTTAAPRTPTSQHQDLRVCVFLGTQDANWGGASAVRGYVERLVKKRRKGACAFFAVEELGHEVPADDYLDLGFDWVLHEKARGGEAVVPERPRGRDGDFHHILIAKRGTKTLKKIRKEVSKGRAFFPFEAARYSEHGDTAGCGGGIDADALRALLPDLPDLEPDEVTGPLKSDLGLHLVWRPPEPEAE